MGREQNSWIRSEEKEETASGSQSSAKQAGRKIVKNHSSSFLLHAYFMSFLPVKFAISKSA